MNVEGAAADQVVGDTIEEIEKALEGKSFADLRSLLVIFECSIGELAHKIARAKGIKNVNTTGNKKQNHCKSKGTRKNDEIGF